MTLKITSPTEMPRFRIGVILDNRYTSKYVYEFVEWANNQPDIQVTHLILCPLADGVNTAISESLAAKFLKLFSKGGLYSALSKALFLSIFKLESALLKRKFPRHRDHTDKFDLSTLVTDEITVTPIVSRSRFVYRFREQDIEKIGNLGLDVLIRGGGAVLRGGILDAATLGIISFHHADNRINRGVPAAFWEVFLRQDTTGFTIQRLTEELDDGVVLMRGHFPTRHFFLLNQAALYEKSNYYLKLLIENMAKTRQLPSALPALPYSERLFRSPDLKVSGIYLARKLAAKSRNIAEKVHGIEKRWNVRFIHSDWRHAVLWRGIDIKNPAYHFLADPFVLSRSGRDYCFVEDYDYLIRRGSIAVYELNETSASRIGVALSEDYHLSFPYIFEYQGMLFMCPETRQNKDIRIYKCVDFPLRWELEEIVMRDVNAVDTMIFERNGKWWMFTNIDPTQNDDCCSELLIFSANTPFGGGWRPHSLNPVIVDASCARNGGLVKDGDRLFRVSQGQGFDEYGKRAHINEIIELTDDTYLEKCISTITPTFVEGIVGTHHLHSNGSVTAFDFVCRSAIKN